MRCDDYLWLQRRVWTASPDKSRQRAARHKCDCGLTSQMCHLISVSFDLTVKHTKLFFIIAVILIHGQRVVSTLHRDWTLRNQPGLLNSMTTHMRSDSVTFLKQLNMSWML